MAIIIGHHESKIASGLGIPGGSPGNVGFSPIIWLLYFPPYKTLSLMAELYSTKNQSND